jgi:Uma2 family endonuclease
MAVVTAPNVELTPEDVLNLSDGVRYELVDGCLVELGMSSLSQYVATRLARFLGNFCDPIGLAYVFTENGMTCFPGHPNRMRRPDVSCVRADRLPFDQIGDGFLQIRPDLAVEVVSPNDKVYELEAKLDDYRAAEIPLVWLVYPNLRQVRVIRSEGPPSELGPDDVLTGEEILPGFSCLVSDLFAGPVSVKVDPVP